MYKITINNNKIVNVKVISEFNIAFSMFYNIKAYNNDIIAENTITKQITFYISEKGINTAINKANLIIEALNRKEIII